MFLLNCKVQIVHCLIGLLPSPVELEFCASYAVLNIRSSSFFFLVFYRKADLYLTPGLPLISHSYLFAELLAVKTLFLPLLSLVPLLQPILLIEASQQFHLVSYFVLSQFEAH